MNIIKLLFSDGGQLADLPEHVHAPDLDRFPYLATLTEPIRRELEHARRRARRQRNRH